MFRTISSTWGTTMPLFLKRRAPQILPTAAAMIEKRRNESSNRWQLLFMLPLENNIVNDPNIL